MFEFGAQGDGVGEMAGLHPALDGLENPPVQRIGEMVGGEEVADPLIRLVVGEQRAEQRLLGIGVGGRDAL